MHNGLNSQSWGPKLGTDSSEVCALGDLRQDVGPLFPHV